MKSQKRKWQGWLLLLAVVLCLGWGRSAQAVKEYPIWVQGTQVTQDNASDVLGDGTVKYNAMSGTLILNNATIEAQPIERGGRVICCGIYATQELQMVLNGQNAIEPTQEPVDRPTYGIMLGSKKLTITGEGSLTVTSSSTLQGSSMGIRAGDLTLESGHVIAYGGSSKTGSTGVWCLDDSSTGAQGQMVIRGGTLEAEGGAGTLKSEGIVTSHLIVERGSLIAKGGTKGTSAAYSSCGFQGKLTVEGGDVTCIAGRATNNSQGILGSLVLRKGTVLARGEGTGGLGIKYDVTLEGGTLTAVGARKAFGKDLDMQNYQGDYRALVSRYVDGSQPREWRVGDNMGECRYMSIGPVTYGVTVTTRDAGMGTATAKPLRAEPKDTVELHATPNAGYVFDHWEVTPDTVVLADAKKSSTSLTMPAEDVVVQAVFQAKPQPPEPSTPTDPPDSLEPAEPSTDQEVKPDGGSTFWFGWMLGGGASSKQDRTATSRSATVTEVRFQLGKADLTYTRGDQTGVDQMDVAPFMYQDRLMVPIRFVAQALGFTVDWNHETRTAILTNGDTVVEIPVGTNIIRVNGQYHESDVPSMIHSDRTMLSLGNVARALGLRDGVDLLWDQEAKVVTIKYNVAP